MVKVYKNVLHPSDIIDLLDYHLTEDERTDTRETVRSKHPRWDIDQWPQQIIQRVLDRVLDCAVDIEEVIFNESTISFQIHADSGYNNAHIHKGIIVPLDCTQGSTVFFDNYWHGNGAKFVRDTDPFEHVKDLDQQLSTKDQRITDYSEIDNFNNQPFDQHFYNKYLTHIPYENLYGLTVDQIVPWIPGDVIVFDRTQLHCASNEHDRKIGVTVFTNLLV